MTVAVIVKGYPRLSETFIAQEILALEQSGLAQRIFSLRHPTEDRSHPLHARIRAPVSYLPEYLYQEPLRVLRAWWKVRRWSSYDQARRAWWSDLRRDRTANRCRRFGQALVLAAELPPEITRLHVHFLHTPGSVARYAGILTRRPWTVSAHAKDIWTIPEWEKADKLADCDWLVTCTRNGAEHLADIARRSGTDPAKIELVYHGLDPARFPRPPTRRTRDGQDPGDPVIVLSVGRAVAKKGHDDLLASLAALPPDLHWRFVHIGDGPLRSALAEQAGKLGIADRVEWLGALPQDEVIAQYRRADLFALACRIGVDGDRDGLPNVLMEAQTQALVCLSTRMPGVLELIDPGTTGLVVDPGDRAGLTDALTRLITDPDLRERLGCAGAARVAARFGFEHGIGRLAAKFGVARVPVPEPVG